MKQKRFPCPCGGKLSWKKEQVVQQGIDCGVLDIEYCPQCRQEYLPEESLEVVESKLKEKGLWGQSQRINSYTHWMKKVFIRNY